MICLVLLDPGGAISSSSRKITAAERWDPCSAAIFYPASHCYGSMHGLDYSVMVLDSGVINLCMD